jgi:ABC-type branched-subunit amino acid transport system ATPase component
MSLLSVRRLTLRFGGLTAVNQVDLAVVPGQIFSVIGPNGAGKTSVFNAITGIYEPSEGEVLLEGRRCRRAVGPATVAAMCGVGVLSALGLLLALNAEGLWEAMITANYVYQQPFPWAEGLASGYRYLVGQPWNYSLAPLLGGGVLGMAGALAVWSRARRAPDVVARHGVARTFQNPRLFHQMTVLENVLVGMDAQLRAGLLDALFRLPRFFREQRLAEGRAMELLRFVELERYAGTVAAGLSYGHQRRLEIARALAANPKVLLLDEPAAGMNPSESAQLMQLIRRIRDRGIAVVLIEHDMKVVMGVSDRIAVLDYGNKIAEGTPEEIRANPQVREAYLGAAAT